MNEEFDLDAFKEDFKHTENPKKDIGSIRKMLNKNSIDNVKYILIISIVEFIVLLFLFILDVSIPQEIDTSAASFNISDSVIENIEQFSQIYRVVYVIFLLISAGFIFTFYKIYKHLKTDQSIKSFTADIIHFRKKANYFMTYNVGVFILFWFSLTFFLVNLFKGVMESNGQVWNGNIAVRIYTASFLIFLLLVGLILVYYRYFWGMFLSKLRSNQKELEEMEES